MANEHECRKCKQVFTNGHAYGAHLTKHLREANKACKATSASFSAEGNSSQTRILLAHRHSDAALCQQVESSVSLPKRTKTVNGEESGDDAWRQGRNGRTKTRLKVNVPPSEKLENPATTKHLRRKRSGTDKLAHKTGRHPTKKTPLDRKPVTQPSHPVNDRLPDCTGELNDDHEELLAAANDAKRSLMNERVASESLRPSSKLSAKEDIERPGKFRCFDRMLPISQRLLPALIVEEYFGEVNRSFYDDFRQDDIVVYSEVLGFNAELRGLDEQHRHVVKKKQNDLQSNCQTLGFISGNAASDIQSQDMDLGERILLELPSIGLCSESLAVKGNTANMLADNAYALSDIKTSANPTVPSEQGALIVDQHTQKLENRDRELCIPMQRAASYPEQTVVKDKVQSTFLKKRAVPHEEVNDSGLLRDATALETTLLVGAKGKHIKRDREVKVQTKEFFTRSGPTGSARPDLGNAKVERKRKLKPRQKTARLSAGVSSLLGKPAEAQKQLLTTNNCEKTSDKIVKLKDELPSPQNSIADDDRSHDNCPVDVSHLLPFVEHIGLDIRCQGLSSWLNSEDNGLIDAADDPMGLPVPTDDLADVNILL